MRWKYFSSLLCVFGISLWNSVHFSPFYCWSKPHQLPSEVESWPLTKSLLPLLLLDTILSIQHRMAFVKYGSDPTIFLLKIPQGLLLSTLKCKAHTMAIISPHDSHFAYLSELTFYSSLPRERPSFICLNKLNLFVASVLCAYYFFSLECDSSKFHMVHFLPHLAISMHVTPWDGPPHSVSQNGAHPQFSALTLSAPLRYLCFST